MPVEIREIIIKTEISAGSTENRGGMKTGELQSIKKQLLEECKRIISEKTKKSSYKR